MKRNKYYVGHAHNGDRIVFPSKTVPTLYTHGDNYAAVVGPFRTQRSALFTAKHGRNNPHIQCISDAERIAKQYA